MRRLDDPYFDVTPPRQSGYLPCGAHQIWWEEAGNPDGIPLVLVHGGPGGANGPGYRRTCDPERFRIVQFDQRGCGKSQPTGLLDENTLCRTIEDMEALREALGIERWIVAGGSWGSTVALAYGQEHASRCLGLLLISVWLCRHEDTHWWFHGVRKLFPELWHEFARHVSPEERSDLRTAYCSRILGAGKDVADEFARRLYLYEEGFMRFTVPIQPADPGRGAAYGRIFAHYAMNHFFTEDDMLLRNAGRLTGLPVTLLTGRYDACTTPDNAFDLAQCLPQARLRIVPGAGHYPTEERLSLACIEELQALADLVSGKVAHED